MGASGWVRRMKSTYPPSMPDSTSSIAGHVSVSVSLIQRAVLGREIRRVRDHRVIRLRPEQPLKGIPVLGLIHVVRRRPSHRLLIAPGPAVEERVAAGEMDVKPRSILDPEHAT